MTNLLQSSCIMLNKILSSDNNNNNNNTLFQTIVHMDNKKNNKIQC